MIYTSNIKKAVRFSTKTHEVYQKQKRKGKDIAYITHPLTVGLILACAPASEEVIIAGILHDTIEDSIDEKKVTREMLVERFGEEVAVFVESVSESNKSLPWEERKRQALAHIETFSRGSLW
jgi:(p)ppGpp synthase/HD superfamily hydrolase